MEILFSGNKPQKKTYSFSVKENNNSNIITFILDKEIEGLDLSSLSCYVKVQGSEIDKDVPNVEIEEDKIKVIWTLQRKHTESRLLSVQLQFEGQGDVVWQTEIVQFVLSDTIKADEYIENKYPAVLVNHEERLQGLEEHEMNPNDYYDKSETNTLLDQKQDILTFDNVPTANSENPVKSGGVFLSLQNVLEIAEGKTQSFTLSAETNPIFNSQADYIEVSSFVDINGNTIDTTKLHVGDIALITQLQVPDRWVADIENGIAKLYRMETAKVDLSAYYTKLESDQKFVNKTSNQEISAILTFLNGLNTSRDSAIIDSSNGLSTQIRYKGQTLYYLSGSSIQFLKSIIPLSNGLKLGGANNKWAEGFINKITDDNGSYSSDNVFNVINASDIVNNTLTQEQYDLITNGKPTLIKGTLLNKTNILLFAGSVASGHYWCSGVCMNGYYTEYRQFLINSSMVISVASQKYIRLPSIDAINGKDIPAYPSNTGTFTLKCVNGVLTWVEDN